MGFPGGSDGKESTFSTGDLSSFPGLGRSLGEENGNLLQCSCLEKAHGWRSLVGYSLWSCKELDMPESFIHSCLRSTMVQNKTVYFYTERKTIKSKSSDASEIIMKAFI